MRTLLLSLLLAGGLAAQPVVTLTGPASVTAGSTANLTVSVSGTTGQALAALQWSLATLPASSTLGTPTISTPAGALGLGVYCNTPICLVFGESASGAITAVTMTDMALSTIPLVTSTATPPGTVAIPVSGMFGANSSGQSVNGITSGAVYSIKVLSRCDLNGDGAVTVADVTLAVNMLLGTATCAVPGGDSCSLVTVERVLLAALGGACQL